MSASSSRTLFKSLIQPLILAQGVVQNEEVDFISTDLAAIEINPQYVKKIESPCSLLKVLCDEECFAVLQEIAKKDDKTLEALNFLRELSVLIEEDAFLQNTREAQAFVSRCLRRRVPEQQTFAELIPCVLKRLDQIRPTLVKFVHSEFFIERVRLFKGLSLLKGLNENDDGYQARLSKAAELGELIELYQESRKEEKQEETKKEQEPRAHLNSDEPLVSSDLMVHYLKVAAKMVGNFVYDDPGTAVSLAIVSCMAVGIGIATCGVGIIVAAAVATSMFLCVGGAGVWCTFFSDSASRSERSRKQYGPTENVLGRNWITHAAMCGAY